MATAEPQLRWELEDAPRPQGSLFDAPPKTPVRSLYGKGAQPTAPAPAKVAPTRQLDFGV